MNKTFVLITLMVCIGFYSCKQNITKPVIRLRTDSLQLSAYLGGAGTFLDTIGVIYIVATLYNPTTDTVRFTSMTCSYEDFFTVSNPSYNIQSRYDCFSNYPNIITLPPKAKTDRFFMIKNYKQDTSSKSQKFRIGMYYMKVSEKSTFDSAIDFYEHRFSKNAIWSEELNLNRMHKTIYK